MLDNVTLIDKKIYDLERGPTKQFNYAERKSLEARLDLLNDKNNKRNTGKIKNEIDYKR